MVEVSEALDLSEALRLAATGTVWEPGMLTDAAEVIVRQQQELAHYNTLREVLRLFDISKSHGELSWSVQGNTVMLTVQVPDFFYWAKSDDHEVLTVADIGILRQAYVDLLAVNHTSYLAELYVARRRGLRPLNAVLDVMPTHLQKLFKEAGPEREISPENPLPERQ